MKKECAESMKQEPGAVKNEELPPPPLGEAEILLGAKVRIWSDAYGRKSWGVKGTVAAAAGEGKVRVETTNLGVHVVEGQHVERLGGLKPRLQARTLRSLTADQRQH